MIEIGWLLLIAAAVYCVYHYLSGFLGALVDDLKRWRGRG